MKDVTFLVLEDDDVDFLALTKSLKKNGLTNNVIRAKDGFVAMELLEKQKVQKPFVILLDINMPRMSGFEFLKKIRSSEKYSKTIVFILTSSNDQKDFDEAQKQLVTGYIVKSKLGQRPMSWR